MVLSPGYYDNQLLIWFSFPGGGSGGGACLQWCPWVKYKYIYQFQTLFRVKVSMPHTLLPSINPSPPDTAWQLTFWVTVSS